MKQIIGAGLLSIICAASFAAGPVPVDLVYDPILEAILSDQLLSMVTQISQLKSQLEMMDKERIMMTDKNRYGDDWYGNEELWMPENFENFQEWASKSDRYKYYDKMFPNDPGIIDPHNDVSREREQYEYSAKWNNYSRTAFAKKFDESYETVERINKMIKEANNLSSPKQSADFQIRMMGELAKLSQQQTELQALQLHLMTIQLEDVKLAKEHNADFWKYTYGQ